MGDYAVFEVEENENGMIEGELGSALIIGSLSDCEAYRRLQEKWLYGLKLKIHNI